MLTKIADLGLDVSERFDYLMRGWDAVDPETGAYLRRSCGRSKYGNLTFRLILDHETPAERGGLLGAAQRVFAFERSTIRAWSLDQALEIAAQRLPRLVKRAQAARAAAAINTGEIHV